MSDKFGALKAAALAATQGTWIKTEDDWRDSEDALITCNSRKGMTAIAKIDGGGEESGYSEPFKSEQQANAAFIAAASPDVVLSLLAALEEKDRIINKLTTDAAFAEVKQEEAEQRLQQPIKLPPLMPENIFGGTPQAHMVANSHNNAITACSMSIRDAGFKSECSVWKEAKE